MAQRKTYVYSLDIILPEEIDPEAMSEWTWNNPRHAFSWPRKRNFLSERGAYRRAALFRKYGATVTVVRSEPVVFTEPTKVRQTITEKTINGLREIEQDLR